MSDADSASFAGFGKMVPGFDFLQNLSKQMAASSASNGSSLPSLGSWVAPTLNVEELDKRIQELKAVQFWLDQNATALKATIQALEVQKMTLATLKDMNFSMAELANAFQLKASATASPEASKSADPAKIFAGLEVPSRQQARKAPEPAEKNSSKASTIDPMQWWGALTQQFQQIATTAMQDVAQKAAPVGAKHNAPVTTKKSKRAAVKPSLNTKSAASVRKTTPRKR